MMKKIAVFLPVKYQGGVLRGVKNIVKMLAVGSQRCGDDVIIVLSILKDAYDVSRDFADILLYKNVRIRETVWETLDHDSVEMVFEFAKINQRKNIYPFYSVPNDMINCFYDCDYWLLITDRTDYPILPLREYCIVPYDYIQRHVNFGAKFSFISFIQNVRGAKNVFVTTPQTRTDCSFFCGIDINRVHLLDIECDFDSCNIGKKKNENFKNYILWISNAAIHKNHMAALQALQFYYEEENGSLPVIIIGTGMDSFNYKNRNDYINADNCGYIEECRAFIKNSVLKDKMEFNGFVTDYKRNELLYNARFLLHPVKVDNGTFSVIEAAYMGVPSLSNDYPQMRFLDEKFKLNLGFADFDNPRNTAKLIKYYENNYKSIVERLPQVSYLESFAPDKLAEDYYRKVCTFL